MTGQVFGIEDNGEYFQPKGFALLFHPDLLRGTELGRHIKANAEQIFSIGKATNNRSAIRELLRW